MSTLNCILRVTFDISPPILPLPPLIHCSLYWSKSSVHLTNSYIYICSRMVKYIPHNYVDLLLIHKQYSLVVY